MICVIGGANIDIQGFSNNEIVFNDSNPGRIEKGFGGVARNIAENLALLNQKPIFMAPVGDDEFSKSLVSYMNSKNADMSHCLYIKDENLSTYLSILNSDNEMVLAIASMQILEKFDLNFIKSKEDLIKKADVLVLDTNLNQDVIEYLSSIHDKVVIDLVSTAKAVKVKEFVGNFHSIKPNKIEVEILTGVKITDNESMKKAAKILIDQGVNNVYITLGKDGIFYMNKDKNEFIPNPPVKPVDITGAGDSFTSGIAYSILKGYDIEKSAKVSMSMSLLNISNIGTCFEGLDENKLNNTLKNYFNIEL